MVIKKQRSVKSRWWLSLALAAGLPAIVPSTHAQAQDLGTRFGMGHVAGQEVGLDDGYTRIGAFVPLMQRENLLLFSDTQLLLYNEQTEAKGGNLGGGMRYFDAAMDRIFGGYTYYDYRDRELAQYHQVGFGFETLGSIFDARLNVNLATDTDVQHVSSGLFGTPRFGGRGGQNIVVGGDAYQQALSTIDAEMGGLLCGNDMLQVKAFIGAYGLYADGIDKPGVKGRLEFRVNDTAWVSGFLQNDDLFGTTGGLSCEFRFGRSNPGSSFRSVRNRLNDPVHRRNHIAVHDTYQDILATVAGAPLTVLHVDSDADVGSGGYLDPVNTLAAASNRPQDIIFVHGGSIFDGESIQISTDGQRLLGEGLAHTFNSDQGSFLLPRVNPDAAAPQINNAFGNAITVAANDVEVANFSIADAGLSGIFGDAVSGFNVHNNSAQRSGVAGIFFNNVNGNGSIHNNIANNNGEAGIAVVGNMTGDIANNTANDNTAAGNATGILVRGDLVGNVVSNTANGNEEEGIAIFGNLTGDLASNTANNTIDDSGIFVDGDVNGLVQANTANNNGQYGLEIAGNVMGDVVDNVTNVNGDGGLVIEGRLVGDLARNEANDNQADLGLLNSGSGLFVRGEVLGDIYSNSTNANAADGLFVRSAVTGDVTDNIAQENGANGLSIIGDFNGQMSNNEAILNIANGARVFGNLTGDVFENTFNDNGNGLFVSNNLTGKVFGNTANHNADQGIDIGNNLTSDVVSGNTTNSNRGHGFRVGADYVSTPAFNASVFLSNQSNDNSGNGIEIAGQIDALVQGNVANGNGGHGMRVGGTATAQMLANQTNANGGSGMRFESDVNGIAIQSPPIATAFSLNEASGNGTAGIHNGIHVGGDVNGLVTFNVTNDNGGNGFQAENLSGPGFLDNTANDNSFNGIVLNNVSVPAGQFSLNTANSNGGDGILMNDANTNIVGNVANNNGDDGIDVDGTLAATPGLNTLIGNADADAGDLDNSGFEGDQPGE